MRVYKNKKDCCGCTACMNICPKNAITMQEDEEGFLYPIIDSKKCINCGLCKKICAFQNETEIKDTLKEPKVYAAKNRDLEELKTSSSGGMFIEIAKKVINQDGIVYGVAFDQNFKAIHIRVDNDKDLEKCKGSKYSQSYMGNIYQDVKKDLEKGKLVLFTGTPCQVGGLNEYLKDINKENLILVDIVCHGTPSPKLFRQYIEFINKLKKKKVQNYYHRSKKEGWSRNEEVIYEDGKSEFKTRLSETWKNIFYSNLCLRPSCYNCKYTKVPRTSDITIADFWGIEKFDKAFYDKNGVSLLIINTEKGNRIFQKIQNDIVYSERKIEEAKEKNPQLYKSIQVLLEERDTFWKIYNKDGFKKIASLYGGYNFIGKIKHFVKKILKKI